MSRVEEGSRRERNKALVRSRLVAAALKLAVSRGFEETTVADIAAAAGVAKGTFFNYFPTKEAIVTEHYATLFKRVEAIIERMPPRAPRDWFRSVFAKMAATLAAERDTVQFVLGESHRLRGVGAMEVETYRKLHRAYVRVLDQGKADGYLSPAHSSDSAAHVLQGVWSGVLEEWTRHPALPVKAELTRRVNLVFGGLEVSR